MGAGEDEAEVGDEGDIASRAQLGAGGAHAAIAELDARDLYRLPGRGIRDRTGGGW